MYFEDLTNDRIMNVRCDFTISEWKANVSTQLKNQNEDPGCAQRAASGHRVISYRP